MIKTKDQAIQFLTTMQYLFPLVHPEDYMCKVVDKHGDRTFNDEQVNYLYDRFNEVYDILPDPCKVVLDDIRPKMEMFNEKNLLINQSKWNQK